MELVHSAPAGAATPRNTEISYYPTLLENHISILDGGFKLSARAANGTSNIVVYKFTLLNNGLDRAASSFAIDEPCFGGAFSDTQTLST